MQTIRTFIILAVVIALCALGYVIFFKKDTVANLAFTTTGSTRVDTTALPSNDASATQGFLQTLLNLKTIKLDDTFFSNNAFTALQDNTVTLPQGTPTGRPNPFAPIGTDAIPATPAPTTSTPGAPVTTPSTPQAGTTTPLQTAPVASVVTGTPTATRTTVTFSATVSGGVAPDTRYFEWGTSAALGNKTKPITDTNVPFGTKLTGLTAGTTYYVRAGITIGTVTIVGSTVNFTTAN